MIHWWQRDVVDAGKLPLMLTFLAFVITFATTRTITRLIRAQKGPFHDQVTKGGTHVHHAVPGLILLIVGAFISVGTQSRTWVGVAAVMIGIGVSLVLDEFALILHLQDVYWSNEGRLSVDLVSLAAACLGLALVGLSPFGVSDVDSIELGVRWGSLLVLALHLMMVVVCVLKGKYTLALFGIFVAPLSWAGALRLAHPHSVWARRRYGPERMQRARRRLTETDHRWDPWLRRWQNLIGGAPSRPDPQ